MSLSHIYINLYPITKLDCIKNLDLYLQNNDLELNPTLMRMAKTFLGI